MVKKESVGLFLQNGRNEKNTTLYIKSTVEGIKTLSDWDFAANSMQCSNKERFESDFSNSVFNYNWRAKKILIENDIAAVSYPEYTDVNKFVIQNTLTGLYSAIYNNYESYNSSNTYQLTKFILPRLNKNKSGILDSNGEILVHDNISLKSLFIIVEYDGYVTDPATGGIVYVPSMDGEVEIFEYSDGIPVSDNIKSTYNFNDDTNYPVLHSRFFETYGKKITNAIATGLYDPRLVNPDISVDIQRLPNIKQQISNSKGVPASNVQFCFIGCRRVTFIKYTPVVKCGRIDLYKKLGGRITNLLSNGRAVSNNHNLIDGNAIRINGARNINGKDVNLNGTKYVQVIDSNTIDLYEDPGMTKKTYTVSGVNPDADWVAVGNVYSETLPEGWQYVKTLTSPTGRNGYLDSINEPNTGTLYETPNTQGQKTQRPMQKAPLGVINSYYFLLLYDIYGVDGSVSYPSNIKDILAKVNPFNGNNLFTPTPYVSSLNALWASESAFIQECLFGSDIDLKTAADGSVYLLAGERGPSAPQNTVEYKNDTLVPFAYPHYSPYGKVHLIKLEKTNDGILDSHVRTISALDQDSQVSIPEHISSYTNYEVKIKDFYETDIPTYRRSQFVATKNSITSDFLYNDYWYGSLLYHLKEYKHKQSSQLIFYPGGLVYDNNANGGYPFTSIYFSNFGLPVFDFGADSDKPFSGTKVLTGSHEIYPYIDSFGKSVALDISGSNFIIATSSKTKTLLQSVQPITQVSIGLPPAEGYDSRLRPDLIQRPYPEEYSNFDCGYVHIFKLTNNLLTKYNKISNRSTNSYSGSVDAIIDKAENYAKTIQFYNNEIIFGSSRGTEFYDKRSQRLNGQSPSQFYNYPTSYEDISRIYIYSLQNNQYALKETITNEANDSKFYSFNTGKIYNIKFYNQPDVKNKILKNTNVDDNLRLSKYTYVTGDGVLDYTTANLDCIVFPSDRFGDSFKISNDILCTNSLDWYNELGNNHADYETFENDPRLMCDYLRIYNKLKNNWTYISKIAASFNSIDSRYTSITESCASSNLRDIGNYNYGNRNFNSKTWDCDLSNSYAIIDERILLKDPVSYSIFKRSPELVKATGFLSTVKTDCLPYFKFDESFYARYNTGLINQSCDFYHVKYGSLYKYNTSSIVENFYSNALNEVKFTTPVFFFSIPKNSGDTVTTGALLSVTIQSTNGSFPANLGLKLYKKDPRTEIDAVYKNNFTYNCVQNDPDLLYSDTNPESLLIFNQGSLSDYFSEILYSEFLTNSDGSRTYNFKIPSSKLAEHTLEGSQLKSSNLISNGESLLLADTTKNTYNSFVTINNTLISGLVIEDKNYSLNQKASDISYVVTNYKLEVYSKKLSSNYYDSRSYSCCYDKILEYNTSISDLYCNQDSNFINTVVGAGRSSYAATNCNSYGDISKSIQVLSCDNIFGDLSTQNISGQNFTLTKSFDINQLNYLSLHLASNFQSSEVINLNLAVGYPISNAANLNIGGAISIDNSMSLFIGPLSTIKNVSLFQKVPNFIPDPPSGTRTGSISLQTVASRSVGTLSSGNATLLIDTVDSAASADLFILGPVPINNDTTLISKGHTFAEVSVCDSPSLFTFGSYKQSSDVNLHIDGNKPEFINLIINGPAAISANANLFLDSKIQKINSDIGLVCHQKPNGNFTLFTSAPTTTSGVSTLFTSYTPKGVNSINNGSLTTCNFSKNSKVFDVTIFEKELLIGGTNSIVDKVYSSNIEDFGYRHAKISLEDIKTDYEFYRFGRNQSLIHWNNDTMIVGYLENKIPRFNIYSINNRIVSLIKKITPYTIDTGLLLGDSYIQDIKISSSGDIAISYYIEIKNASGEITAGRFLVDIFNSSGIRINRHSREFNEFSEELFLSNCMGLSLLFTNNKLFYTKELGYDTIVIKCDSPNYSPANGDSFFNNFLLADRTTIENNITKGYVPYNRSAFGHKIEVADSGEILISAPLFNRYLLVAPTVPPTNNPDPIDWVNIAWYNDSAYGTITSKQITGLTAPINLKIIENVTSPEIDLYYRVTNTEITGDQLSIPSSPWVKISSSPGTTFSVSNNQWVSFCCYGTTVTPQQTVSVLNAGNSDQVIDTFAIQVDK